MSEQATATKAVEVDGAQLASAPVDALAGVTVAALAVVGVVLVGLVALALVSAIVGFVIWLVNKPWGIIALGVPLSLVTLYAVWMGSFYASVVSLEALGVKLQAGAVRGCLLVAPALAAVVGPFAGLRTLGRGAAARPALALAGAVALVALGIAIGRLLP